MTSSMTTVEAREKFLDVVNHVHHSKERVIITRRDKEIAAIVSVEDLHLLLDLQDKHDLKEATDALKDARQSGTLTLDQLKNDIGS